MNNPDRSAARFRTRSNAQDDSLVVAGVAHLQGRSTQVGEVRVETDEKRQKVTFQAQRDSNQPPTSAEFVSDYETTRAIRARKRFTLQGLVDLAMGTRRFLRQMRQQRWKRSSESGDQ